MNKEKKTYVEPNMKVVEIEAEAIMAGSCTSYVSCDECKDQSTCDDELAGKMNGFSAGEDAAWKD